MEIRVIGRGALAGFIAGILGFCYARIFAEPIVQKAIDYESDRNDVLTAMLQAVNQPVAPDGPEIFSRSIQSTVGIASGIIGVSVAFGLLVSVAYLILRPRVTMSSTRLVWEIVAIGFVGIFLLPYVKYPSNPPAIGHEFTIGIRGALYLSMVAISLVLLIAARLLHARLRTKLSSGQAALLCVVGLVVVFGVVLALMPSLGNVQANIQAAGELGYTRAATETPAAIYNTLGQAVTINGTTYAPGQLVFPGFDADVLWGFRWCSLVNQILLWSVIGIVASTLFGRLVTTLGLEPIRDQR